MVEQDCTEDLLQAVANNDDTGLRSLLKADAAASCALTVRNPKRQNRTLLRESLENGHAPTIAVTLSAALSRLATLSHSAADADAAGSSNGSGSGVANGVTATNKAQDELIETLSSELCSIICGERSLKASPLFNLNHHIERKETLELLDNYQLMTDSQSSARVEHGLDAIRRGTFVVVQDDQSRENEGDLITAAEKMTTELTAFMIKYTSGVICAPITRERCEELELPQMVPTNTEKHQTAFTVSVDLRHGTSTGISAADRAATIRALAHPSSKPGDFNRPGHIFPLRARPGGVLERNGHTEASVDLARLAGFAPAACICEIANPDGSMMRTDGLIAFCKEHQLPMLTIIDLQRYIRAKQDTE